jgi:hypothetical protein
MPQYRVTVFKPTQDDWHPSYQLAGWYKGKKGVRLVAVTCVDLMVNGIYRVHIWGADDDGLEKDVSDLATARELFDYVIRQKYVNKNWLRDKGFVQA